MWGTDEGTDRNMNGEIALGRDFNHHTGASHAIRISNNNSNNVNINDNNNNDTTITLIITNGTDKDMPTVGAATVALTATGRFLAQ